MTELRVVFETEDPPICCIMESITAAIRDGHISGNSEGFYHWDVI